MSGIYLAGVVVLWFGLTWVLFKLSQRVMAGVQWNRWVRIALVGGIAVVWASASLWYAGGRKIYYDKQVERLCALDGGIKVYETVGLPADMFNQWGQPKFYAPNKGEHALGPEYTFKSERDYSKTGTPAIRPSDVAIARNKIQITRKSDSKLLGEVTQYYRAGGDVPGPWMPSGFSCPPEGVANELALMKQVFVTESEQEEK